MIIHVVKNGDSLYSIGKEYGVNYLAIASDNELPVESTLVVGQTIVVSDAEVTDKRGIIDVNGYAFPNIDDATLKRTMPNLTYISPFSYEVKGDGSLSSLSDEKIIKTAVDGATMPLMVITNLNGAKGFSSDIAHEILTNPASQEALFNNVLATMKEKGYAGLNVDIEYVYPADSNAYNDFIKTAADTMHNNGFTIFSALAPKTSADQMGRLYEAHDYAFHGSVVDFCILMTYEWGYTYSVPMAVAPIPQIKAVLDYAVSVMPSEKILMGMPNYGYDWVLPYKEGTAAKTLGNYEAVELARKYKASISYDEKAQAPYFDYYDENKKKHQVWFEDARSIKAKLNLPYEYNLAGVSYWSLNRYFPQNWLVMDALYDVTKT